MADRIAVVALVAVAGPRRQSCEEEGGEEGGSRQIGSTRPRNDSHSEMGTSMFRLTNIMATSSYWNHL